MTRDFVVFPTFCEQQEIYLIEKYPQISTYIHENGLKKSQIEYILSNQELRNYIESIDILTNQSTNTSDHNPTIATLNIDLDKKKQDYVSKKVQPRKFKKVNWNKVDIMVYEEFLNDNILPFNPEHESNFEVIEAVNHLCRTLHNAVQKKYKQL